MNPWTLELEKAHHDRLVEQARLARLLEQNQDFEPALRHRMLENAGDALISLGMRLKRRSQPSTRRDYAPQF